MQLHERKQFLIGNDAPAVRAARPQGLRNGANQVGHRPAVADRAQRKPQGAERIVAVGGLKFAHQFGQGRRADFGKFPNSRRPFVGSFENAVLSQQIDRVQTWRLALALRTEKNHGRLRKLSSREKR